MISIDVSSIIVVLNFVILLVLLKAYLYKPIKKFLTERQDFIASKTESMVRAEKKAQDLQKQRQTELDGAMDEAKDLRNKAKSEAELTALEIIKSAKEQKVKILEDTEKQIDFEKEKAIASIESEIAGMVSDLSGKFMNKKITASDDEEIINRLVSERGNS